ncbi:bifunctional riboflavin kinase/FAD synthetase [Tissierella creatinini]|nr:bifunctional riboflavin kinase/FAD synthetase [Tissierella creatinini]TJX69148.1 bifunctional riboflavin kinase/FAD synthetase [Soehngenia saccharolytica]
MELLNVNSNKMFETAIALGNFDGVHIGHQELIKEMIRLAKTYGYLSSVLMFDNHTKSIIDGKGPSLITCKKQRYDIIQTLGVNRIYTMEFDELMMKLSPEEFVTKILIGNLNVKAVVVGTDYRFGYKAVGDAQMLKKFGNKYGIKVNVLEPIYIDGEIVSSTRIRKSILNGDMKQVSRFLGRNYSILGKVVPGKRIGNKIGFPTANIEPLVHYVLPKNGVYSTETVVDGIKYLSASSVGYNPTFREEVIKIESHIIGFARNIYDLNIELIFIEYLREEKKFENIELLKRQILDDIKRVKKNKLLR